MGRYQHNRPSIYNLSGTDRPTSSSKKRIRGYGVTSKDVARTLQIKASALPSRIVAPLLRILVGRESNTVTQNLIEINEDQDATVVLTRGTKGSLALKVFHGQSTSRTSLITIPSP